MFFFFCLSSWVLSKIQNQKKPRQAFLKKSVFQNIEVNSNIIERYQIQSLSKIPNQKIPAGHDDDHDGDDHDDDDDDKKVDLKRFLKWAKTTTGILTLSISSVAFIVIIILIVICCKNCGLCVCCNCCKCCHCGSKNAPSAVEQYGQVILNNEDDIDYGLESI